ncbi:hypothetical protein MCERH3_00034 [Candidatus Nanopelagicaceae bacterium]
MSRISGQALHQIQKHLGLFHQNLIHIEGGLGSQILGAIAFWNLQEKVGPDKAKCDLTYFTNTSSIPGLWPYELNRFDLPISDFQKYESKKKTNLLFMKKDFLFPSEINLNYWQSSREKYLDKFGFDKYQIQLDYKALTKLSLSEPFGVLHIRRGDYLQVASKIIGIEDYVDILKSIKELIPKNVLIISDSEISPSDRSQFEMTTLREKNVIYLDQPHLDNFLIHCIMREAEILVTANSTFSFSAGLLARQGQRVLAPIQFHGGQDSEKYNRTFRDAANFAIWPTR